MTDINQVTIVLTLAKQDTDGKVTEFKRRFSNINPQVSNDQIKTFSTIIERLTGESYSKVEVIKTMSIL